MGDYEDYWFDRETIDEDEDIVIKPQRERTYFLNEVYKLNGEKVRVLIDIESATFTYENGTHRTIPLSDLKFCPECMKKGSYPFYEDDVKCHVHESPLLKFTIENYERFKLVSMMGNGVKRQ